jgi:hypothetical protein
MKVLKEAGKEIQTETEKRLKKKILALLRNDGKGHHHAKYAARLQDFPLKIVPRSEEPNFVAAVSWENVTIYVSDGFVTNDKDIFYQLSVLMRHELAHYLLQHDIRMAKYIADKYGDEYAKHFKLSNLLHQTCNIIMDLEISNKVYLQDDDKDVVRNLTDGVRFLPGLVTDDIASKWTKMTLIEMYDAVEQEIEDIKQSILAKWDALDMSKLVNPFDKKSFIKNHIINELNVYTDSNHPTNFFGTLNKFLQNKALYHFAPFDTQNSICMVKCSSLPDLYVDIISAIAEEFTNENGYTRKEIRDRVIEIAKTSSVEVYTLMGKNGNEITKIYNPEEKFLAIDALKAVLPELDEYDAWYAKVQKVFSDPKYSDADRQKVYDAINK